MLNRLMDLWSLTQFTGAELTQYAERFIADEVRKGVMVLGVLSLILLGAAATLYAFLGLSVYYVYTFALLAALALHVAVSSRMVRDMQVLYLLGMALLTIAGVAFVLLAHKTGAFSAALMSSVVLLFTIVPIVPWGIREATFVVVLIYLVFTLSTVATNRFGANTLWILQFLMLGSGLASLTIVARNVGVRKHDITARYDLENAHRNVQRLSYQDPLTGAWNRRFLDARFAAIVSRCDEQRAALHFALIDVDKFKQLNDTRGHANGDIVLQRLVAALQEHLVEDGYVIRIGGDEFAIIFCGADPEGLLRRALQALSTDANALRATGGAGVQVSTGVVSMAPQQLTASVETLYREADRALYSAKGHGDSETGGNSVVRRALPASAV